MYVTRELRKMREISIKSGLNTSIQPFLLKYLTATETMPPTRVKGYQLLNFGLVPVAAGVGTLSAVWLS